MATITCFLPMVSRALEWPIEWLTKVQDGIISCCFDPIFSSIGYLQVSPKYEPIRLQICKFLLSTSFTCYDIDFLGGLLTSLDFQGRLQCHPTDLVVVNFLKDYENSKTWFPPTVALLVLSHSRWSPKKNSKTLVLRVRTKYRKQLLPTLSKWAFIAFWMSKPFLPSGLKIHLCTCIYRKV